MSYVVNYPERLEKALREIDALRKALHDIETGDPHLISSYKNPDAPITDGWEFWTTDEVLEQIGSEISDVLLTCKKSLQVVGNPDELNNDHD